jgi:MerR family transcriptional regulator, thiopeptide resistance regulator
VRAPDHYDEIGLLSARGTHPYPLPPHRDADLERLQQILYCRELGFSLEEIAAILDDPDAATRLRRQRRAPDGADRPDESDGDGRPVCNGGTASGNLTDPD